MNKKMLAFVLSGVLCVGLFSVGVVAEEAEPTPQAEETVAEDMDLPVDESVFSDTPDPVDEDAALPAEEETIAEDLKEVAAAKDSEDWEATGTVEGDILPLDAGDVETLADSVVVTTSDELTEALEEAQDGDTITLGADIEVPGTDSPTIYYIYHSITIDLGGHTVTTLGTDVTDGGLFTICTSDSVTLKNGTISGGGSAYIAAVANSTSHHTYSSGNTITLEDLTLTDFDIDGAIVSSDYNRASLLYFNDVASLTMTGCTLKDSHLRGVYANQSGSLKGTGTSVTISGCTMSHLDAAYTEAKGIFLKYFDTVSVTDCKVMDNGKNYKTSNQNAAGIELEDCGKILLSGNTITGNESRQSGSYGGGLVISIADSATLTNNTISGNACIGNGAGMYLWLVDNLILEGNVITDNEADGRAGGVYITEATATLSGNTISGNRSSSQGGAIYIRSDAVVTSTGDTISGNTAATDGGGIYNQGTLTVSGSRITENQATGGYGGGVYQGSAMNVGGEVTVSGNTALAGETIDGGSTETDNVYLPDNHFLTLIGEVTGGEIGVTSALSASVTEEQATDDNSSYTLEKAGLPELLHPVRITTQEDGTDYYAASAAYFTSDKLCQVRGCAEDRWVEFYIPSELDWTVEKTLTNSGLGVDGTFEDGDVAEFTITVTNTGNVTIRQLEVMETLEGATFVESADDSYTVNADGTVATVTGLAPGEDGVAYLYAQYTVREEDLGQEIANIVTTSGGDPSDPTPGPGAEEPIPTEDPDEFYEVDEEIVPGGDDEATPDSWVKQEAVNVYDTIEIEMSTTLPKLSTAKLEREEYEMTFHNQLDRELNLDALDSDFRVYIGGAQLDSQYYDVDLLGADSLAPFLERLNITDGCAFHVTLNLSALYRDGVVTDEDLGTAPVRVFFYVDLETEDVGGSYASTVWYSLAADGEEVYTSDVSTVEVYTFEFILDKYDTETKETLPGATFGIYHDEACESAVTRDGAAYTVTSGSDGQAAFIGITEGTYYVKELEAPKGYDLSEEVLTVTLEGSADGAHIETLSFGNTPSAVEEPEPDEPTPDEPTPDEPTPSEPTTVTHGTGGSSGDGGATAGKTSAGSTSAGQSKTGDTGHLFLYIILILTAGAALAALGLYRRRI